MTALPHPHPLARALVITLSLLSIAVPAGAASPAERADVRRLLAVLAGVRDEYREALDETGRVVRSVEIEEAKLLLADGRDLLGRIGGLVPPDSGEILDRLEADLDAAVPEPELTAVVEDLRTRVSAATGVADARPNEAPSAARGAHLFADSCTDCHGVTGAGDGPEAARLQVHPADFTDPEFMRAETPQDFFNVITLGRRRSGMPEWDEALSPQERWDLIAHLWTLTGIPATTGADAYRTACASCHGAALEGAAAGVPRLDDPLALAQLAEDDLVDVLGRGTHASVPAVQSLSPESRRRIAAWVQRVSLTSAPTQPGTPDVSFVSIRGLEEAERLLAASLEAARRGEAGAAERATEAYVSFEPFEPALRVRRPELVDRVEQAFVAYRLALRSGAAPSDLEPLAKEAEAALEAAAAALLAVGTIGWGAAFWQSAAIIVREGVEVILIVGALLTWVRRRGVVELVRAIHAGVVAGVVASVATAVLLATGLRRLPWAAEAIEGAAMLVAAVVLFWVSYWLISKAEADRWQRFIRDRVESAIGRGSLFGLGAAAFLAVYREGFETVLFYQALVASGGGAGPVMAGLAVGAALLAAIYGSMRWLGMQIPIRPFFLVTGTVLYALSIVFAGRGVAELQEAGLVAMTPVGGIPTIPALGLYPTWETLAAQGVLLALLVFALIVTIRRQPRAVAATAGSIVLLLMAASAEAKAVASAREWLMGTVAEVRIERIDRPAQAEPALEAALAELRTVDRLMAVQRPGSDVSRANRDAAAGPVAVDQRVVEVLAAAGRVSRLTGGAFDVTVLPVVAAWGFLEGVPHRPTATPPRPAGWQQVEIDDERGTVRFATAGVGVDLGGIAKGYALDRARAVLLAHGVRSAWLDLGGNVATVGVPPDAPRWRIAIRDPRVPDAVLGTIEVGEAAVSTSSDAERFVEDAEGRVGHVIDPRTGEPAHALVSATVVTAAGTLADALSTAALVVGEPAFAPVLARAAGAAVLVRETPGGRLAVTATAELAFVRAPEIPNR